MHDSISLNVSPPNRSFHVEGPPQATEGPKPTYIFLGLEIGLGVDENCDEIDTGPPQGTGYDV